MIPKVKTYQITTDDGAKHLVDAPTKLLAKLNFRHAGNYDAITRIRALREIDWATKRSGKIRRFAA
jgi:hypothetical protein